ncbi:MAG: NAD(P)-binding domain-containing protein [Burkholderiales bacterium]|jgi:putative flavoprotein involved in K+ transport
MQHVETVIVGAGPAGLATSRCLQGLGREHVVLERGRVAERWRTQRWDSLRLQSPNWSLELPGDRYGGDAPDGFCGCREVIGFLERYRESAALPVLTGVAVDRVRPAARVGYLEVRAGDDAWCARHVVVATGPYQVPIVPALAHRLSSRVTQVHASDYRSPEALPPGAVLVVGSGASGSQIAEDLHEAGRRVHLCIGPHARAPRRYRGRDVFAWRRALGLHALRPEARTREPLARNPLVTGAGGGRDVNLRACAAAGIRLHGRLVDADGERIRLEPGLNRLLDAADADCARFLLAVDAFCAAGGVDAPRATAASACPARGASRLSEREGLDLLAEGIAVVVWATGYGRDFRWLEDVPSDRFGEPLHDGGGCVRQGLHLVGLPWMRTAISSFLYGVGDDARATAERIAGSHRVA